jgi:hypothetical protein
MTGYESIDTTRHLNLILMIDLDLFAAYVFVGLVTVGAAFQIALVAGMPWGELTLGGKFPERLPGRVRVVSLVSACLLIVFGLIVATSAGLIFESMHTAATKAIWFVVGYCALGVVANAATRSKRERIVWLPVVSLMLFASLRVAL